MPMINVFAPKGALTRAQVELLTEKLTHELRVIEGVDNDDSSSPSCWPSTSSRSLPGSVDESPTSPARTTRLPSDPEMGGLRRTSRTC